MKNKSIKSTKSKTITKPKAIISIKQKIIGFEIQANELQNKILEKNGSFSNLRAISEVKRTFSMATPLKTSLMNKIAVFININPFI